MSVGRRASGWGVALLFFLATGPIALYTFAVLNSLWQGTDDINYVSSVLLPFLMVFPYVLWCAWFLGRGARGQAGFLEHLLILLFATPVLALLASAFVAAALDGMGGFVADDDLWWLVLVPAYLWQIVQYVIVQLVHKGQHDKAVTV